ncbi:MAG: hypothetical protein OEM01_12680 [Desulfobulbaceae bacterium]|nr:hypothetical protein [Desulfobulbaceae bacterium]
MTKIVDEHRELIEVENHPDQGNDFILYSLYQGKEEDQKIRCWKSHKCGIEKDASRRCSAFPYFGRRCWSTAGSFSEACIHGISGQKIANCQQCSFYKRINHSLPLYTAV